VFLCVWLTENQVHGLDKEEAEFLDFVQDRQQEIEKERHLEEVTALQELRVFFGCVCHFAVVAVSNSIWLLCSVPFSLYRTQPWRADSAYYS